MNKQRPSSRLLICGRNTAEPMKQIMLPIRDKKKLKLKEGNLQTEAPLVQITLGSQWVHSVKSAWQKHQDPIVQSQAEITGLLGKITYMQGNRSKEPNRKKTAPIAQLAVCQTLHFLDLLTVLYGSMNTQILQKQTISNKTNKMSSSINAVKLFQISMNYDRHRLKLNSIKSKSSPLLRKEKEQVSILQSRNAHKEYNSKFKTKQNLAEINKKNTKIFDKLEDLSRVKRPTSYKSDKLRNSMVMNRSASKMEGSRNVVIENERFLKKLFAVKSTINNNKQTSSFYDHRNRSQMLSKFKRSDTGRSVPKSESAIEKRIELQPIHKKLCIIESRVREIKVSKSPLKFNSVKLLRINPEKL